MASPNPLKASVEYYTTLTGTSKDEIAIKLGMSRSSFYAKLNRPNEFTLGQFQKLVRAIKLTPEEINSIIYTQ